MSDIRFGTKWAHADYGLIVAPYAIPMPEPQTNFVEIPGRDGALDLSEAFGSVRYADRTIPLTLYVRAPFDTLVFRRNDTYVYDRRKRLFRDASCWNAHRPGSGAFGG